VSGRPPTGKRQRANALRRSSTAPTRQTP
jgi:hypothetical protein